MLGRLVLLLLQIAGGYVLAPIVMSYIPVPGTLSLFLYALVVAIIVFLIGLVAAQILKDVGTPHGGVLSSSLALALIVALIWTFGPDLLPQIPWSKVPDRWAVLAGAVLGYAAKR